MKIVFYLLILISVSMWFLFYIIRFFSLIYEIFCIIFPHITLSEENFCLQYGNYKQNTTFSEFLKIYWEEFFFFFYTDLTLLKVYYSFLLLFLLIIFNAIKKFLDIYFFKIFNVPKDLLESNYLLFEKFLKEKIETEQICLESNLFNYHKILLTYYKNFFAEKNLSNEEFDKTKKQICFNILELFFILKYKISVQDILWLKNEKKKIKKKIGQEKEYLLYFVYSLEIEHFDIILEFLERNEMDDNSITKRLLLNTKILRKK